LFCKNLLLILLPFEQITREKVLKLITGEHMSLNTTGIDHLNLDVKNLNQTVEFYNKLFGFTVLKEQPEENAS